MSPSREFRLRGYADRETAARVDLVLLSPAARVRRAVLGLLSWWGAGVVCVFIPIAHFVLVPGCFIMGIVALIRRLGTTVLIGTTAATCPDCGAYQQIDISGPWRGFTSMTCRGCQRTLNATPADYPPVPKPETKAS